MRFRKRKKRLKRELNKMYKCIKCGATFEEFPKGMVSCPSCAGKIITKMRSEVTKSVKAR